MLSYDDLAGGLEDAWIAAGLHEHTLIEAVVPDAHDRTFRVELFPDHPEPLTDSTVPPWVEISFTWTALHQLRSEGHDELGNEPLEMTWAYNVPVHDMVDRSDTDLVRQFRRSVQSAYAKLFPEGATSESSALAVEVRRTYTGEGKRPIVGYVQLVTTNITDLSEMWTTPDPNTLRSLLQLEIQFAATIIATLAETFTPGGRGSYRPVDAA